MRSRIPPRPAPSLGATARTHLQGAPAAVSELPWRDAHPRPPDRSRGRAPDPPASAHPATSAAGQPGPGPAPDRAHRGRRALTLGPGRLSGHRPRPLRSEPAGRRRNLDRPSRRPADAPRDRRRPSPARSPPNHASGGPTRASARCGEPRLLPTRSQGPNNHPCPAQTHTTTVPPPGTDPGWFSYPFRLDFLSVDAPQRDPPTTRAGSHRRSRPVRAVTALFALSHRRDTCRCVRSRFDSTLGGGFVAVVYGTAPPTGTGTFVAAKSLQADRGVSGVGRRLVANERSDEHRAASSTLPRALWRPSRALDPDAPVSTPSR